MQIKNTLFLLFFVFITHGMWQTQHKERIIILDPAPAGDAQRTGRSIGDSFERGLTLQYAEKVKSLIEQRYPNTRVIITRLPGDIVYDLQNASLANRLSTNLFVNINFYHTNQAKPTLSLYQFSYGNDFSSYQSSLSFNTYDQAYTINKKNTDMLTQLCAEQLTNTTNKNIFSFSGPHALPVKPLIGIIAPSIMIEIGLKDKDSWHAFAEPLITTIIAAIEYLEENK